MWDAVAALPELLSALSTGEEMRNVLKKPPDILVWHIAVN